MFSLLRKLESYNTQHRGCIRKILSYLEFLFLIVSIPIINSVYNFFDSEGVAIQVSEYTIYVISLIITWNGMQLINSQAKIPRTQRYLYVIFYNSQAYFLVSLGIIIFKWIFHLESISVQFILMHLTFFFAVSILFKLIGYRFLKIYRANGYNLHYVLIIADGFSDQIIDRLIDQKEWGFKILGIVTNSKLIKKKYSESIAIIPEEENLMPILDTIVIDEIIYSKYKIDEAQIKKLMSICSEVGIIFRLQSAVSPIEHEKFQFTTLNNSTFLRLVDGPANHYLLASKTLGDYYLSIVAIILLFPLFLIIAILIKIDSKGPIFFKQERIGLRGRKFNLYKFRTMIDGAEAKLIELKCKNESDGPVFKIANDPRITRVGKILRKTGLDELPQLQNVILGEMSLIGPRPPLECEVKHYERWQLRRLSVKPGITGSWQVIDKRNDVKFESWMKMDLNYIDNWSLIKDFQLFLKTILIFFMAKGR